MLKSLPKLRQRNPQVDLTLVEFQGGPLGSWHCGQVPEIWLLGWQCDLRAVQGPGMSGQWHMGDISEGLFPPVPLHWLCYGAITGWRVSREAPGFAELSPLQRA